MPDIFLSYNREDQASARRFAEAFGAEGFEVWWDVTLRSGEAYDEVTENALRTAKAVVVLWSPRSALSRWVRAEATLADRNKTLIPVTIEPCERPIMFELIQTAELSHWRGEPEDQVWRELLADVRQFVARDGVPVATTPAPGASTAKSARPKRGGVPSLAILPFTNRSGLTEDDVFAFGMVEDIIDAMSQGVEVRVVSSSATARFRLGAMPDLDAMARELGVRYVLEGNVRRSGDILRVTTQLVEAANGNILWTQRFERALDHLAELQEDLVLEVASHLRVQSYRLEIERAVRKPGDLTAWEAVMRSIAAMRRMTGPGLVLAMAEARRAVEIAPDYGLALALLSEAEGIIYFFVTPDNPSEVQRIRALAEQAMRMDPEDSAVLSTASGALTTLGLAREGLAAGERAVELNANNEFAHFACGIACARLNRAEEALAHFDREQQLAPNHASSWNSFVWRANALARAQRWAEAVDACDVALKLAPDNPSTNLARAVCCWQIGRHDEARASFLRARASEPDTPLDVWERRLGRAHSGSAEEATMVEHLQALWKQWG